VVAVSLKKKKVDKTAEQQNRVDEAIKAYETIAFFFFKQKAAYEIKFGDWSSDVCSSDLICVIYGFRG